MLEFIVRELAETRKSLNRSRPLQSSDRAKTAASASLLLELRREVEALPPSPAHFGNVVSAIADRDVVAQQRLEIDALRREAGEARQQAMRHEREQLLVEDELDRLHTQSAEWRREMDDQAAARAEEALWPSELEELRITVQQAAAAMSQQQATYAPAIDHGAAVGESNPDGPSIPWPVHSWLSSPSCKRIPLGDARRGSNS